MAPIVLCELMHKATHLDITLFLSLSLCVCVCIFFKVVTLDTCFASFPLPCFSHPNLPRILAVRQRSIQSMFFFVVVVAQNNITHTHWFNHTTLLCGCFGKVDRRTIYILLMELSIKKTHTLCIQTTLCRNIAMKMEFPNNDYISIV